MTKEIQKEVLPLWKKAFPNFNLDVEIPDGFEDESCRHDVCPHWANKDLRLVLSIDYDDIKKSEMRESIEESRFILAHYPDGPDSFLEDNGDWYYQLGLGEVIVATNDFNDILKALNYH